MLEELEDKVLYYFVKFSNDASEINRRLYDRAWLKLAEHCTENNLPLPIHHLNEEKDGITKKNNPDPIDISDDVDVPYLIDSILEGDILV